MFERYGDFTIMKRTRQIWIAVLVLFIASISYGKEYRLGFMTNMTHPNMGFYTGGAVPFMALDRARADGLLGNNTIRILFRDDKFNPTVAMGHLIELYEESGVDGFIGVGSSPVLVNTCYLMSYWNLPVLTQGSLDPRLGDRTTYPTLLRFMPTSNKIGKLVEEVVAYFGWKRILILSRSSSLCEYASRDVVTRLVRNGILIPTWFKFDKGLNDVAMAKILDIIKINARIIYFCGENPEKEKFMIHVYNANLTSSEYVYLMPPYRPLDGAFEPWTDVSNPNKDHLLEASQAFIQMSLVSIDKEEVKQFLIDHVAKMAEVWNYNMTANGKSTSMYTMFLHDSVYLYVLALNKTLERGDDPRDGKLFFETARALSFQGVSGYVAFDENGDREPTGALWYIQPGESRTRLWGEVALSNPEGERIKIFEPIVWRTEDGKIPRESPVCGFSGELCLDKRDGSMTTMLVLLFLGVAVTGGVLAACYIIRNRSNDQQLRELLWRVNYQDLIFIEGQQLRESRAYSSMMRSSCDASVSSQVLGHVGSTAHCSVASARVTGNDESGVALYNGQLVSVKIVKGFHSVTGYGDTLAKLRELKHQNINPFIGACVDQQKPFILTTYCRKGNLKDILANVFIELDSLFKESLIHDLVNGMVYFHNSPIKTHGNLKSSSCVIDSRWVLKISDFYHSYVIIEEDTNVMEDDQNAEELWTAPEILRAHDGTCRGSKEGDVFSFSIILQEILYRAPPYFMHPYSPKEIIERIKASKAMPFRPDCTRATFKFDFIRLMQRCWDENPENRPTFKAVQECLRDIGEIGRVSVMDRMLLKLESYSTNLEGIVRERTQALSEEKMKTDSLLYQMIPRFASSSYSIYMTACRCNCQRKASLHSRARNYEDTRHKVVAEKLKQGLYVSPELYEKATVYFSDILGFEAIAAESSPMEVVTLLNDLYEMLDELITSYDVYKVETIGDSYMVVSGIPDPNGNRHVAEIADMSLHILQSAKTFQIRHRPGEVIQLRVGFHTGPCCAGVVGLSMPRYCLFGDTVNTASRMESNSKALQIHVSLQTCEALNTFGCYVLTERGEMFIKFRRLVIIITLPGTLPYIKPPTAFRLARGCLAIKYTDQRGEVTLAGDIGCT